MFWSVNVVARSSENKVSVIIFPETGK